MRERKAARESMAVGAGDGGVTGKWSARLAVGPTLGVVAAATGVDQSAVTMAAVVVLLAVLSGTVVLIGVVLPAVWSRRAWRRRAALTVLRELRADRPRPASDAARERGR